MTEIIWDKSLLKRKIHPAIDMIDDVFYFGLSMPVKTTHIKNGLVFINSNKEVFPYDELDKRQLELMYPDVASELRWDIDDIKRFLNSNEEDHNPKFKSLLVLLTNSLKKYIELADETMYSVVSLWVIGTYLFPIWRAFPYLSISGARRCGKSKLLTLLYLVAFNGLFSVDISPSTIYRLIQSTRCTLLIDEAERLASPEKAEAVRNILNAGYKKGGKVYRSDKSKDSIKPRAFDVFSAKAFVSYEGIEDITEDRCIQITMLRGTNPDILNSEIDELDECWAKIRDKLYTFALTHYKKIKKLYDNFNESSLTSRERELWKPILVLAQYFGIYQSVLEFAVRESKTKIEEETLEARETVVLQALEKLVDEDRVYYISEIKNKIIENYNKENEPVPKWLTTNWIGRCLSRTFKIRETVQHSGKRGRRISRSTVENLCRRYGVPLSPLPYPYQSNGTNGTNGTNGIATGDENHEKSDTTLDTLYQSNGTNGTNGTNGIQRTGETE